MTMIIGTEPIYRVQLPGGLTVLCEMPEFDPTARGGHLTLRYPVKLLEQVQEDPNGGQPQISFGIVPVYLGMFPEELHVPREACYVAAIDDRACHQKIRSFYSDAKLATREARSGLSLPKQGRPGPSLGR